MFFVNILKKCLMGNFKDSAVQWQIQNHKHIPQKRRKSNFSHNLQKHIMGNCSWFYDLNEHTNKFYHQGKRAVKWNESQFITSCLNICNYSDKLKKTVHFSVEIIVHWNHHYFLHSTWLSLIKGKTWDLPFAVSIYKSSLRKCPLNVFIHEPVTIAKTLQRN